ncbi:MAG: hypothetical protein ABI620_07310 [Chloroflexota bacterium]
MSAVAILVAACGTTQPSPSPVATPAPTIGPASTVAPTQGAAATPAPTSPFGGRPYSLTLPEGWQTFDLSDPAGAAALDSFVTANPAMGASIEAFKNLPNVTMAVNALLGNVVVALSLPTGGATLEALSATFTAQFAAVPGVAEPPQPENLTLPVGPAVHWDIKVEANKPGGGTYEVGESVYLVANATTGVLVEFVEVAGGGIPQEQQIINSLAFTP